MHCIFSSYGNVVYMVSGIWIYMLNDVEVLV